MTMDIIDEVASVIWAIPADRKEEFRALVARLSSHEEYLRKKAVSADSIKRSEQADADQLRTYTLEKLTKAGNNLLRHMEHHGRCGTRERAQLVCTCGRDEDEAAWKALVGP